MVRAVQHDPNCTATMVIRNMANVQGERDRLVRSERDAVCSKVLGGMKVGGNVHETETVQRRTAVQ